MSAGQDDAFEIDDQDQLTLYGQPVALMAPGNDEKFNRGVAHVLSLVFRGALNARFEQMLSQDSPGQGLEG